MSTYALIAADLLTGRIIAELPFAELQYANAVNASGTLNASVRLDGLDASVVQTITSGTVPARSCLYVERDGVLVWGGPVWGRKYNSEDRVLHLDGTEFLSLFDKFYLTDNLAFRAGTDYAQVARALVQYAQSKETNADFDIIPVNPFFATGSTLPTNTISFYYGDEGKSITQCLLDLANLDGGPDFSVSVGYEGTSIVRRFHVGNDVDSNRAGTRYSVAGTSLRVGIDADGFELLEDGWAVGNYAFQIGSPPEGSVDGTRPPTSSYGVTEAYSQGWPRLESMEARQDVSEVSALTAFAKSNAEAYWLPAVSLKSKVTIRSDNFTNYNVGDEVRIELESNQDPRWPDGLNVYARIAERKVTVNSSGEVVEATMITEDTVL